MKYTKIFSIFAILILSNCKSILTLDKPASINLDQPNSGIGQKIMDKNKKGTVQTITLNQSEHKTIDDVLFFLTPMGHKMMTDGTESSFFKLTISRGDKKVEEIFFPGTSVNFENYTFKAVNIVSDGESATLEIKDTRVMQGGEISTFQELSISLGETKTIFDLTVTNRIRTYEIGINESDDVSVDLTLATPRKSEVIYFKNFTKESKYFSGEIIFDNFKVLIVNIEPKNNEVTLVVTKTH